MIPLTGYTDRLSARPGERIAFRVSAAEPGPVEARLVRVVLGDPNPAGPGRIEEDLGHVFRTVFDGRFQSHRLGSHVEVEAPGLSAAEGLTLEATVWPTLPGAREQAVLSLFDAAAGEGIALVLAADGSAGCVAGRAGEVPLRLSTGQPLACRGWYRLRACYDAATGRIAVTQTRLDPPFGEPEGSAAEGVLAGAAPALASPLRIAAHGGAAPDAPFSGKIEAPAVWAAPSPEPAALLARWDFSVGIPTLTATDTGPRGLHGRLVNLPARGMKGHGWTGREQCWRHAPEEYAAIHFHDTDLADCGWETAFEFTLPEELRSGAYAMRLTQGALVDTIPFFAVPPRGRRTADLCVIVPTFTYVVYGNHARVDFGPHYRERAEEMGALPTFPVDHPEYGWSTYNEHSDGSGICHASPRRPMMTLRPGYMSLPERPGSGLRHYPADTHLLHWLEGQGIAFDLVTDHEIHAEGPGLLAPYRCVLTTSHPEYHTAETLGALVAYRNGGGRFCYLGGNGFYWRVALHGELADAIEIRRGEGGIRAWAAETGEYYNAFDGAYGGLWRRSGRPPQALAGLGFSAQGTFEGSHYRLTEAARHPRAAWIFEGVKGEVIGDHGMLGGGAAGFELDRSDTRLGTPAHALVLARSEGHGPSFVLVPEEQLTHLVTLPGEPAAELIRAELLFFETPAGGAVFSTGSITFIGSLNDGGGDNDVSRMFGNVVRRFLDPEPFAMP